MPRSNESKTKQTSTPPDRLEVRPLVTDRQQPPRPPAQARGHTSAAWLASLLGLALLASPALPAQATPLADVASWQWKNGAASDLCLGVALAENYYGQHLQLVSCTDALTVALTVWTNAPIDGHYTYTSESTRLCLDTEGAGTRNDTPAVQGACTGSDTQAWAPPSASDPSDDARNLIQKGSARCLDTRNGAVAVGTPVVIGDCTSSATQRWIPLAAPGDTKFSWLSGVGSHNTYDINTHPNWLRFVNALDSGPRQVEIDLWLSGVDWFVSHDPDPTESQSKCVHDLNTYDKLYTGERKGNLNACLVNLRLWSEHNPGHDPVIVKIELKDGFWDQVPLSSGRSPKDLDDTLIHWLNADIGWSREANRIFTPTDLMTGTHLAALLQPPYETLDAAAAADAWPTVNALKGKFIVLLIRGTTEKDFSSDFSDWEYIDQRLLGWGASPPAMAFPVLSEVEGGVDPRPNDHRKPYYIFFDGAASKIPPDNTFYKPGYMLTLFDAQVLSPGYDPSDPTRNENPTLDEAAAVQAEAARRGATIAQTDWWSPDVNSRVIPRQ